MPPTTPTPLSIAERVRNALGVDLQEIPGVTLHAEIPLAAGVLNRLIAARLATAETPVASATIELHDANALTIHLRLRTPRLLPTLKIAARIEQQPELPQRPVLGIRWSLPGLGPLAMLAGPVLSFFTSLPRGIRVERDWIAIDVHEQLRANGLDELIAFLVGLRIVTFEDRVVVTVQMRS